MYLAAKYGYLVLVSVDGSVAHGAAETSRSPGRSHFPRRCGILPSQPKVQHIYFAAVRRQPAYREVGLKKAQISIS